MVIAGNQKKEIQVIPSDKFDFIESAFSEKPVGDLIRIDVSQLSFTGKGFWRYTIVAVQLAKMGMCEEKSADQQECFLDKETGKLHTRYLDDAGTVISSFTFDVDEFSIDILN